MAADRTSDPDDEPTAVSPAPDRGSAPGPSDEGADRAAAPEPPQDVVTDAPLWPDAPRGDHAPDDEPATGAGGADDVAVPRVGDPPVGDPPAGAPPAGDRDRPDSDPEPAARSRGRSAADRTAEGAKVAADRVSQAASATAQALRDTDVGEIARNTTKLIENTRPFFLAAFAIVFTFLASVENHAAVGVVFAVSAVLCVLGAAFSPAVDRLLKRGDRDRR